MMKMIDENKIQKEMILQLKSEFPKIRKLNIEEILKFNKNEEISKFISNHNWIDEMNETNINNLFDKF